ncbi:MAG: metallophosphoesterase [Fibrella sp.]|nr:metallophosphoesterase [Armatimonadota bacterium]
MPDRSTQPRDHTVSRRALLTALCSAPLLGGAVRAARPEAPTDAGFSFVHITDPHIQPELGAVEGVRKAFAAIAALSPRPTFALIGGDIVMDAAYVGRNRAEEVYDLWQTAADGLGIPLHYSAGNHDIFAVGGSERLPENAPDFGKALWMRRLGLSQRYATFEHGAWKFIVLDSVQVGRWADSPNAQGWRGELDAEQMVWLDDLLRKTDPAQPLVFLTHVPILTLFAQYTKGTTTALGDDKIVRNGKDFVERISTHNVRAVLQGHTHVYEDCQYRGVRYITGGAVCGDWWKGPRLGVHPEGFGVATVYGNTLDYRYHAYGWRSLAPDKSAKI